MNLVGMLLNQLSTNTKTSQNNSKSNIGFDNFLNNAQSKVSNNNYNFNQNNNNNKNGKKISDVNNNSNKSQNITKNNNVKNNANVKNQPQNNNVYQCEDEKVIIVDKKVLSKLEETLGLDATQILDILASLSMSVSMLQEPKHLIQFLQKAFNVENPVELLSMDNMKNIMDTITKLAKSIDYDDLVSINDDNFKAFLEQMSKNVEVVVPNNEGNEHLKENIENLMKKLNGEFVNDGEKINDNNKLTTEDEIFNNTKLENKDVDLKPMPKEHLQQGFGQQNPNLLFQENKKLIAKVEVDENFNISNVESNSKVFNASLPKTQSLRNINHTDVINQIMDKIKVSIKPNVSEIKMLLKPEQLGEITLKIATQNGIVTAQFIAESQRVKEIIEANFNQLRDMLYEQGVDVGQLEVNVSSENEEQNSYNEQNQNKKASFTQDDEIYVEEKENLQEELLDSNVNYSI